MDAIRCKDVNGIAAALESICRRVDEGLEEYEKAMLEPVANAINLRPWTGRIQRILDVQENRLQERTRNSEFLDVLLDDVREYSKALDRIENQKEILFVRDPEEDFACSNGPSKKPFLMNFVRHSHELKALQDELLSKLQNMMETLESPDLVRATELIEQEKEVCRNQKALLEEVENEAQKATAALDKTVIENVNLNAENTKLTTHLQYLSTSEGYHIVQNAKRQKLIIDSWASKQAQLLQDIKTAKELSQTFADGDKNLSGVIKTVGEQEKALQHMSAQYADNERKMREDLHLSDTNNKYMSIQLQKELSALRNRLLQQEKSVTHRECQLMKAKGDRELSKFPGERLKRVTEIDRLTKRKVCLKEFLMTIDRMQVIDSSIICGRLKSALDSLKYITRRHEDAVSSSSNFEVRRIRNSNEFQKKILERNKVRINQRISERELEIGAVSDALQTTSGILEDVKRECKRSEEAYAEKEALAATQTIEAQTQRYKKETSDAELFITRATTMLDALSLVLSKLTAYELSDGSEKEEDDVPVDIDLDISELIANSERSRPTESLPQRARLRGKRPGAPQSLRAPPRSKLSESLKSSEVRKVRESPVAVARPEGVKKHQTRRSLGGTVSGRSDIAVPHKGYESAAVRTSPYEDQSERKRDGDGSCVLRSMTTPFRASLIPATRSYTQLEEVIQMAALKDSELLRRREDDEEELMIPTSGSFRRIPRKEGDVTPKKSVQQELNLPVRRTPPRELELIRKRTDIDLGLSLPARRDLRRELELTPKRKHIDEDLNSAQKTKGEDSPSSVPKENLTYVKELSTPVKEKVIDEDVQGLREAGSWFLDWPGPLKKFDELVSVSSPKISTASGHPSSSKTSPVDRKSIRNHGEMETQLPVPGISRHFDVAFIPRHPHEPSMPRAVNRGGIAPFSTSKIGIEEVKQVGLEGLVFVKHIGISAGGTGPNDAGTFGDITAQHSVDFDDGVCEVREPAEETARMSRRNVRPESLRENRHEEGNMGWNRYYYLTRDQSAFGDLQLGKDYVTGLSKVRRAKSKKVVTGAQRRVNRDMVPLRVSFDAQGVPTSGAHDMWMWSRRTRDEWKTKRLTSKGKVRVQKRAVSCRTNRS